MASRSKWALAGVALSSVLLVSCGGHMAPVSERSLNAPRASVQVQKPPASGYYRVKPGDTLYSIAWRYGKDYRALARANKIGRDYRIYSGQKISLRETSSTSSRKSSPGSTAKSTTGVSKTRTTKATTRRSVPVGVVGPVKWRWPASGRVIQGFSHKGKINKGINLSGKIGDSVLSAGAGVVVYSGNGLLGYGNLIIINHNETFLSAYAHNHKLLVKEQQRVKAGQKIAEIGNSGAAKTMLHFEIRKEGKPVDPLRYLPRR